MEIRTDVRSRERIQKQNRPERSDALSPMQSAPLSAEKAKNRSAPQERIDVIAMRFHNVIEENARRSDNEEDQKGLLHSLLLEFFCLLQ